MAHLFRPTYRKTDPETGEPFDYQLKKWYAQYKDADGKRRRVPLSEDKASAQSMLAEILRTVERQKAGLIDKAADQLDDLVQKSIDDFEQNLESRGRSESHISETIRLVRNLVNKTGCVVLRDLQRAESAIEKNLADQRKAKKSHRTINAHLTAIRSFCRWLVRNGSVPTRPYTWRSSIKMSIAVANDGR
jgi:hypothetical protein